MVIFAPRQTGKTSFFYQALARLEANPSYTPIALDFETYSKDEPGDFYRHVGGEIIFAIKERLKEIDFPNLLEINEWLKSQDITNHHSFELFFKALHAQLPATKVVIIIDEFDGIPPNALSDFLYTLRKIYNAKRRSPRYAYIHSVGIVGVKSIGQLNFDHTISPFNVQDQFSLSNFTAEQVAKLYEEYTQETGQLFTSQVIEAVHRKTAGQPFLVNRMAQILTEELGVSTDKAIAIENFHTAYETILNEDNTHFQHLRHNIRRKSEFKGILSRILFDDREFYFNINDNCISELSTYGLVRKNEEGLCVIDNPIYQEIIIKTFTPSINGLEYEYLPEDAEDLTDYISASGEILMDELLANFRDFIKRVGYKILEVPVTPQEYVGQYLLVTYLDLFVRKIKGHIYPEVPTGRGRMDILILYRDQKYIVETKLWRGEKRYQSGKRQLAEYLDKENTKRGYYIIFDHRQNPESQTEHDAIDGKEIISYCIPMPR